MCILVLQYTHIYIEIMLLMSLIHCINIPTIYVQIVPFYESCTVYNLLNSYCMNLYIWSDVAL